MNIIKSLKNKMSKSMLALMIGMGLSGFSGINIGGAVSSAHAAFEYPKTLSACAACNGQNFTLNGEAIRQILFVQAYKLGLYTQDSLKSPQDILSNNKPKILEFYMYREVKKYDFLLRFHKSVLQNDPDKAAESYQNFQALSAQIPAENLDEKDRLSIFIDTNKVVVYLNDKPVGTINSPTFGRAILGIFLGPQPIDPVIKTGLSKGF